MDIETTPAVDTDVNEEEGHTSSDLTKLALTAAATAVVIIGGKKVLRRAIVKLATRVPAPVVEGEVIETTETPETVNA